MKKLILTLLTLLPLAAQANQEIDELHALALWSKHSPSWTEVTVASIREHKAVFERARGIEKFCPGYAQASPRRQEVCWLRLFSALARFESNYKAGDMFVDHTVAVVDGAEVEMEILLGGLLSITTGTCEYIQTREDMTDPLKNLRCGVEHFARLMASSGTICGTNKKGYKTGPCSHWSPLRKPYKRGRYNLGKQKEMIELIDFRNVK